jgi:periplasmic protein TonB
MISWSPPRPGIVAISVAILHAAVLVWMTQSPMVQIDDSPSTKQDSIVMAMLAAPVSAPQPKPLPPTQPAIQKTIPKPTPQRAVDTPTSPIQMSTPVQEPSIALVEPAPQQPSISTTSATTPGKQEQHAPTVVQPSSSAAYLNNPKPPYPALSRRLNEQGMVVVRVLINTDGKTEQTELFKTSGYSRLDESALKTVTQWRFVPGTRNGVPQAMWFNVPIHFVLE